MDSNQPLDNDFTDSLTFNTDIRSFLQETAKWANFIAIVGFVFLGLFVVLALLMSTMMSAFMQDIPGGMPMPVGLISTFYILMAIIGFFPILYLYRFAQNTKVALRSNDQENLTIAFQNLKSHYKFYGILMAILLGFYALIFVLALVGSLFTSF